MPLIMSGDCKQRIFGLQPAERLRRQVAVLGSECNIAADASAVLSEGTLLWLQQNPGTVFVSASGRPMAVSHPHGRDEASLSGLQTQKRSVTSGSADYFNRQLRRREPIFGFSLAETAVVDAERQLFDGVYKGVTDIVTKWVWPTPAFWVTRLLARHNVSPNAVTAVGILCMFIAAFLFAVGSIGAGLVAAWLMTFLDTVDGKLARVTVRSSRVGNLLDHWTDVVHPPFWWICIPIGIIANDPQAALMTEATALILLSYVVGRIAEVTFKLQLGFNQFIWRPFDAAFRLVIARRNTILLLVTVGALIGTLPEAWLAVAAWSVASALVQCVRLVQGWLQRPIGSFLSTEQDILLISLSPAERLARETAERSAPAATPRQEKGPAA